MLGEEVITFKVKSGEKSQIHDKARLQGKTVSKFARDRCMLEWTHHELEDLGFGLIVEKFHKRGYPDGYIKNFVGEMLRMLQDIPTYSKEYVKEAERYREALRYNGVLD